MTMSRKVMSRVGWVLVVVGLVDIAMMIYAISLDYGYSSSLNVFAVVAGAFLIKGSLGAARIVTVAAAFLIGAFVSALLVIPFLVPLDLWRLQYWLDPIGVVLPTVFGLIALGVLVWAFVQLRSAPVLNARAEAGQSVGFPWKAFACGPLLVVLLSLVTFMATGEAEINTRAVDLARTELGPAYQYKVTAFRISSDRGWARVTAYNDREIKSVEVEWKR